jgi:hypothetical protein
LTFPAEFGTLAKNHIQKRIMKNVALMLAVSTLLLAGCSTTQIATKSGSQKSAIESIFAQRTKLKATDGRVGPLNSQRIAGLMAIDVHGCPADFRSAWFDYLIEAQNLHKRIERVALFAAGEGKPVTDLPALIKFALTNPALGQYLLDALNKDDDALAKLERVAMNYGVMPEH